MNKKDYIPISFPSAPFGKYPIPEIQTDPYGAYTGVPEDLREIPVQDADDL